MADRMHLRVYTPERQLADAEVSEVIAPGALGEIGVLPDHAALVTALDQGVLSYKQGTTVTRLRLGAGFAEIKDNLITVLTESGEPIT